MTSDVDYAAVAPVPVGILGIRMRGGQLLAIKSWLLDHERRHS